MKKLLVVLIFICMYSKAMEQKNPINMLYQAIDKENIEQVKKEIENLHLRFDKKKFGENDFRKNLKDVHSYIWRKKWRAAKDLKYAESSTEELLLLQNEITTFEHMMQLLNLFANLDEQTDDHGEL